MPKGLYDSIATWGETTRMTTEFHVAWNESEDILMSRFCSQELCKELHKKIDIVDEARYDVEAKVAKGEIEVCS